MEDEKSAPHFLKDYAYARSLLKDTSRGKNPDWYRDAHLLPHQVHLFESGSRYLAYFWSEAENKWANLTPLPTKADSSVLEEYISYLQLEVLPTSCRSLGVVLHLNQEASVFEFPIQDWNEIQPGATLRDLIREDPASVLQDRTLSNESLSFQVFPTPASPQVANAGCAVATSRRGETILQEFRNLGNRSNFPIRTIGLSSPLLLLSRLPRTLGPQEKAFCTMLRFEEFSFFGFYSAEGELILLKSIKHTGKQLPHSLESTFATTAASVELAEWKLQVFDCRVNREPSLETELAGILFSLEYQVFVPPVATDGESIPIELSTFQIEDDNAGLAFSETETFGANIADGYHLQDFLSPTQDELELIPGAVDMKILRIGRILARVGVAACVLFGAFVAFTSFKKTSSPVWKDGEKASSATLALSNDLSKVRTTEKYLADRSKGWVTLELFSSLFPLDGSVKFESADHRASAEQASTAKLGTVGLVKKWTITGFAREEATANLVKLNTQAGMGEVFSTVRQTTGNSSFDLKKNTRSLLVNLDLSENSSFKSDAPKSSGSSYPYKFSLEITQRIEAGDPLAVPLTKL
ncbi:MAG: hypothetical protein ACSHYB_13455 [Roseibacillus sp.]